jgi:hypothetical protein
MVISEPSVTSTLDRIFEELRQLREENSRILALLDGTASKRRKNEAGWRKKKPEMIAMLLEIGYLNSEGAGLSSQDWNRARRELQSDHPDWLEEDLGRLGKVLRLPTTPIERIRSSTVDLSSCPVDDPALLNHLVDAVMLKGELDVETYLKEKDPNASDDRIRNVLNSLGEHVRHPGSMLERLKEPLLDLRGNPVYTKGEPRMRLSSRIAKKKDH